MRLVAIEGRRLGLDEDDDVRERREWDLRRALAMDEMVLRVRQRLERPTDAELRRYFGDHRQEFVHKREYEVSVIRLDYSSTDPEGQRHADEVARELAAWIRSGELEFEDAARESSDHRSASDGGYVGWISLPGLAAMSVHLAREISDFTNGGVTREVDDEGAYWIGMVHLVRPERLQTFEEARASIETKIGTERTREISAQIEAEVQADLDVALVE